MKDALTSLRSISMTKAHKMAPQSPASRTISKAYGDARVTNVMYDVAFTFHTCDRITSRWQENAYTTNDLGYGR